MNEGLVLLAAWAQWLAVVGALAWAVRNHLHDLDRPPQPSYRRAHPRAGSGLAGDARGTGDAPGTDRDRGAPGGAGSPQ